MLRSHSQFGSTTAELPRHIGHWLMLLAGCLTLASMSTSYGGTRRHDRADSLYLDLADDAAFDPVGKFTWAEQGFGYLASGTLIRDDWVLTAAHVVDGTNGQGAGVNNLKFNVGGTNYTADEWIPHSNWSVSGGESNLSAGWDIGLVHLSSGVGGIAPAEVFSPSDGSELGLVGTQVGFGATGTGSTGYQSNSAGTKRAGNNILDVVGTAETSGTPNQYTHDRLIAVDFDNKGGGFGNNPFGSGTPLDLEYLIAPGDSGGGLFLDVEGEMKVAGVTSYISSTDGNGPNSDYGDRGGFTRVSQFIDWINDIIGEEEPTVLAGDYNLDGVVDGADYTVWRDTLNEVVAAGTGADGNVNGEIDAGDLTVWTDQFGKAASGSGGGSGASRTLVHLTPEPSSFVLAFLGGLIGLAFARRRLAAGESSVEGFQEVA